MVNDNKKKLYDALSGEYDLGTYEEFETALTDETKRRKLYDAAKDDYDLGTYEEYSSRLGSISEPQVDNITLNAEGPEKLRGFWANFKESSKGLWAGLKGYAGEQMNLFTGSSREEQAALNDIEQLEEQGINALDYLADQEDYQFQQKYGMSKEQFLALDKKTRKSLVRQSIDRELEGKGVLLPDEARQQRREQINQEKVLDAFHKALEMAGGDLTKAKAILREQATDKTVGDILIEEASETMSNMKQPEGFAGWVGNLAPQMIPSATALALNWVTKGKASNLSKWIGYGSMGGLTLSTAGMSMLEAREAGATNLEVWTTGIADGLIEIISEKIPFDRITGRVFSSAKAKVADGLSEAISSPSGKKELEELLVKANEKLGGKLFSKKNVGDGLLDTAYEAGGEFAAEALQTITTMIYENPENYPTISEVLAAGWEGAKAGLFMGSVLGGASKGLEHSMNKQRRQQQGFVDVAQIENENGEIEVVEVVGQDPATGKIAVLHNGEYEQLDADKIGDTFRFSYDEFENARLKNLEDEAIDEGTVNNGQVEGMRETVAKDIEELRRLDPNLSDESIEDLKAGRVVPEKGSPLESIAQRLREDSARLAELENAKAQERETKKNAARQQIESSVGQQFWMTEENNKDAEGNVTYTQSVEEVVYADGRTGYVVGYDDAGNLTMVYTDGTKGFTSRSEITDKMNSGEIVSDTPMGLDEYLDSKVDQESAASEQARMSEEYELNVQEMIATHPKDSIINLGTEEEKIEVPIIAPPTKDGVIVQMPDGSTPMLSWEDVAHAEKKEIKPRTDAQNEQSIVDQYKVAYASPVRSEEQVPVAEREKAVQETTPANPLPRKADGSVDQTALWNTDPVRWAKWNDEQRKDGGANSLNYVNNAIVKEQNALDEMLAAYEAESDFDARDAMEAEINKKKARLDQLVSIAQSYSVPAQQTVAPAGTAAPTQEEAVAPRVSQQMSEEEKTQMDAQHQERLEKAKSTAAKREAMQAYVNEISQGSVPMTLISMDGYEQVMKDAGCSEDQIEQVRRALKVAKLMRMDIPAFFVPRVGIFAFIENIPNIEQLRLTYVHERQHRFTSQDGRFLNAILNLGLSRERLAELVYKLSGSEFYAEKDAYTLADEIISYAMERAYTSEDFSVALQELGVEQEIIDIITEIDNEQRQDYTTHSSRRGRRSDLHDNTGRPQNGAETDRNSEAVSGGLLGQQGNRPSGDSNGGDLGGRQAEEGAEVISDEQLSAPFSGEPSQITAEDGEVIADTNGKGGVRFSIRTWREGGRDYLAAWLDNDKTLTDEEKADILARMDEFYENAQKYTDTYAPFGTWSEADVRYDSNGNPLMSVIKANGDYAMNLDFSLVCKKRRPLNRLLRTLINRNAFGTYSLKEREIAEINWILQEHGFEVACALCFVDSKRYRVTGVADVFAALYNKMVKALAPEGAAIAHFNYNGNPNVEVVENGIDTMADEQLNWAAFEKYAKRFKPTSVEGKVAQLLRENPSQRRLVDATDFIEAEGFEAVKANNQELLKLYNAKKGTGGPKASFGDVQYLNDILKKEKSFDVDKAYAVGGVRIQSFSDFVPHMYFDYMQLFAELAAKKLPAHAYTKEVLFAKIFGLTGLKINLSLVPAVVEGGIAPGLDAEGNYAWADAVRDAEGNIIQQAQTFPFDEAMEIQNAEGYSKNCGAIAVGISDEHIEKMLDDPNIQFIIPYHKSSLNAIVARMTNIDQYKDYTNVQTTKKASGTKLDKGTKDFNFNEYLHNLGENGTPQQAAQAYLDWCKENNFRPKFSQFAYHPNYYKLLVDFNTVDTTTGEYTPQGAVTMTFPTEQNAFGNVETLIEQGLGEDMALEEKLEAEVDEIANEVEERLAEIAKEPKLTEKQQLEKMAELADERAAQIKARSEGTIELVEEARKANALHRVKEAGTLVPGHEKGQSMMTEGFDTISFRVTKNTKATIESWCKKANLDQDYTDSIIAYLDNTFEDTTEQLCAARWYLDGKISLPDEDEYKVRDAVKVAKQNKVDPLSFSSPMEIIDRFGTPKTKAKPINPDTVKEFSNKTELPEEIVVYDVQDDFEGQEAVRKIIDTHWGEDANPWCLAARIDGSLERAKEYWQHYSRYPKRIAFRNGKLLAFFASADKKTWWDRLDSPHEAIPYSVKSKEGEYEVSTNYELKEGNKKATQVSVGKSDGKGKTAYFVKGRLDSAGIQDGQRNLFYSSFPAGATLTDSVYGPGNSIEIQYGPLKNVTQISVERRPKEGTSSYMRVGYNNNGVRNISFVENARSWDIRFGLNGDHIIVGRADIIFNQKGEIESVYSGAYSMNRTDDGRYEFMRGAKTLGTVAKGEKVSMDLLREFGEDGAPVGALLDFVNGMGWNRGDYPYPNPADADILRNDADVRKMVQKAENDINEVAGKRYLASVSDVRFRFAPRTEEQKAKLFDAAKAKYGTTNNFNATGYMLPDGSLLDFSEANDGGDPNSRSLDHRDIEGIIMDEGREYESRYNYVTDFVGEGAIRMLPEYAGFQLSKAPTAEQRSKLMDYIYKHNGEVIMEITNENGNNVVYMEYNKRTSPSRIFKDMDGYFNEGVVPGIPPIRFRVTNEQRDEVQFRTISDALYEEMDNRIEELEAGEKIKVYRAMQLIDGKLYPPMSAKVDGELRAPIELGQWEEAEERPDLADNKGYFKLDKGNKKSLKARYNPYFHTSYTPLNDQFSEAQDRPNLVTVEVEIPVSELTSGYKADKAKDSVGEKEWKAGVIQGKLSGTRKVILSRWDKPVRIVPDSEVADIIVKMFEGKNIVMPSNVVTPSLRAELESRGVPFVETDNQGKMVNKIHSFDDIPQDWYDSELQSKVAKRMQLSEVGDEYFAGYAGSVIIPAPKKALAEKIGSGNKEVMIKRGVFAKMGVGHRFTPAQSRNILASSLYATNLYGQSQKLTRPLNWVIIKTGDKNTATVIEVNETKDYLEVVSWYTLDERNLKRIKRQAQSEGGDILILDSEEPLAASLSALPSDLSSESKGSDNIDTANELEENISFSTGTPTEEVVAEGVNLSKKDLANLAGDIFAALPEDSRKKITEGLNENLLGLQDAIMQIPVDLAIKEEWNDEDRKMAEVVAEQMTKAVGKEMTRPFSASEALWTLYNAVNKSTDLVSEASRALVRRNLGFDPQTLEQEKQAKDGVRFRTVGDASANAQASMYNRGAANVWTRLKESFIDMNASVEKLVKAIEKRSGKIAQGFENILLALNQQSSKGLAAMEAYEQKFLNKMFDEIRKIMDKTDFKYEDIVRYVILKHGLERNIKLAQRDAKAHYQEIYDDIISKINGMNAAQKRTYLTNAQLRDADAKAELARLQAVNTSTLTPDQLRDHKKYLAKAKKEATDAAEHLARAQKIATMTEQDALDELDKIFKKIEAGTDSVYKEMRKNDYSGISSMFYDTLGVNRKDYATEEEYQAALMQAKADKYDTLGDIEGAAQMEVTFFENAVSTDDLWSSINKATKETLRQQYEANMISKDQYENLRNMFEFYVPLRGFADNTAEDMYTYYRKPNSTGYTKPILGAEGRKTEAESPFGWIAAMAGSAIASNVKNEAKLALYYFVSNRPDNGIATLSRTWFVHTPGDVDINGRKVFRPAYPPFNEDLSTDAAKQAYELWQEQMRDLQKQGLAYEAGQRLNLGNAVVNISDTNKPEHIVNVKVSGKDYTIVINGNPRAAQAINGDLNIEATAQDYSTVFGPLLRWMSSVNTSYNPEFWITNMMRDMAFTFMSVNIKEDPAYRRKFFKNYIKAFKVISMVAKNEKGTIGDSYIEQQYKDFVKYGGVTGYTQIKDSETWEKEIESYLASNDPASLRNGKVMRGMKSFFHGAHRIGESLEQVSRFAAFLTAVETGKSINEAINDAKEITVNFNRKGSGKMITLEEAKYLTDKNGQPLNKFEQWMAVGLSSIAPLGRRFIMFFNAAIQGLNATYKLYAKNKTRSIGWALGYAAVGMINAVLHAMLDDDDDYLDIPQYERRNSLMIGWNGTYAKWALPQEARAFYAFGDLAVESVMGRNPHQNALVEALKISTEVLPMNPSEGWKALMPSVAIPFVELALNEDYKGAPIYNEQKWLSEEEKKRSAKWSKAYSGTGKIYVDMAKVLNAVTGGDEHDAGLVNLQPEKIEHIVQSAFGGTIRTADKFVNTIMAAIDPEEDVTVRQFPFLNRILTVNDERYKNVHVNDLYDYYAAEAEHAMTLLKQYKKDRDKESYTDLLKSDEYKWAQIYSKYKKPIKKYQEAIRAADTTRERMELMKQQDELKRRMIKEISEL